MTPHRSRILGLPFAPFHLGKLGARLGLLLWAGCLTPEPGEDPDLHPPPLALHKAAERGDLGQVRRLLSAHPEAVNARDEIGSTPLHRAADTNHLEVVRELLSAHAQVDAQNAIGQTPLYWAAFDGHADVVRVLLEHQADPLLPAKDGTSPTSVARAGLDGWQNPEVIRLLESRGGTGPCPGIEKAKTAKP